MDNESHQDLPPPPYTLDAGPAISNNQFHQTFPTSGLYHHLTSLPDRIYSTRQSWATQRSFNDSLLLGHIVPIIEDFITGLGSRHNLPLLATLTLVPETAVPENAVLSGSEDMQRLDEVCLVSRVKVDLNEKGLTKAVSRSTNVSEQRWTTGQEFSDWGRLGNAEAFAEDSKLGQGMLWWRNEDMARRLADYLQPKVGSPEPLETTSLVKPVVGQKQELQTGKRTWNWAKRRSKRSLETTMNKSDNILQSNGNTSGKAKNGQQNEPDRSQMSVTAQEVAFRQENELGIMESHSGWAVVVAVTIRA